MTTITLPHNYTPRDYQLPLLRAMDSGFKRAVCVWHRRAGKDKTLVNYMVKKMMERVGVYYYLFPTYNQGKKIIWKGIDKDGFRFIDHFPKELIYNINNSEMTITMIHPTDRDPITGKPLPGSLFQIIGTDNIDSIVGTNPVGCLFSEYSLQNPRAWDFLSPVLAENGGFAIFNFTPRGENHGWQILEYARKHPDLWFSQVLTVEDTHAIPEQILAEERERIIAKDGNDAHYQQEYMCSFKVPIQGAYYGHQMMKAKDEGRITKVPYDPLILVDTWWDLGMSDATAIWFVQVAGQEIRLIDYYETSGEGLPHYKKTLQDKEYSYGQMIAPHDIAVRELGTGKSRLEAARELGIAFDVAPRLDLMDGIEQVRAMLSRCWFDEEKTAHGVNALMGYHKMWDEENKIYKPRPEHDWTSHGSDALRTGALKFSTDLDKTELPDEAETLGSLHA